MSQRPAIHHSNSSPLPYRNSRRTSTISSSPSTSSSSTLQDATPSDATCQELPDEEIDRTSELERDRKPKKQVAFSAVSLEIGPIKGYRPDSTQLRHTDTPVFYSPPPPLPADATIKSSKLAARLLAVAAARGQVQHPPKIPEKKIEDNGISSPVKRSPQKANPVDAKQAQHVRFSPTTTTVPPPPALSRKSPPVSSTTPEVPSRPTTEIVFRSDVPPEASACADISEILRTVLNIPGFDFGSYAQDRTYVARRVYLASDTSPTSSPATSPASSLPADNQTECTMFLEKSLSSVFTQSRLRRLGPQPSVQSDLFVVRCGPDKNGGNSMFALKEISTHQLLLAERPTVIFPFVVALDGPQKEAYFEAFQCLNSESRNAVCQLDGGLSMTVKPGQEFGGEDRGRYDFQDVFVRNSLQIELPVPNNGEPHPELSAHRGLFLKASRIKHRPNAVWSWDIQSFSILIRAVRPVAADEEITVAFVSPEQPYEARKNALWLAKGVQCLCQSCGGGKGGVEGGGNEISKSKAIQEGDSARRFLVQSRNLPLGSLSVSGCDNHSNDQRPCLDCPNHDSIISFEQWLNDKSIPEDLLVTAHKEALHIIEREGLHILNTQSHKARTTRMFHSSFLVKGSSPLSPSSLKKVSSQVFPCEQRDVGYHTDALVLCYGALGDATNFVKCLTEAIKDRDERGAWMLESKLRLRRALVTNVSASEKDDIRKQERAERNTLAFRMRLAFSKWVANPASFPLWGRRKSSGCGGAIGGVFSPTATGADVFELCDSLEEYALGCLAVEVSLA